MAEHGGIEIFEIFQPVRQDGFEDVRVQGLVVMNGDVSETGHLLHPGGSLPVENSCRLQQGEAVPRPFRKAEPLRCDHVGSEIEGGLDSTLQVEEKDVLDVNIFEAPRIEMTSLPLSWTGISGWRRLSPGLCPCHA